MEVPFIDPIKAIHWDHISTKLREFFKSKGLLETALQQKIGGVMAACEDPSTIATFEYAGMTRVLPQTNQMNLEWELLRDPSPPGYFCYTTSYRAEKAPVEGRHQIIFPMIEFEIKGSVDDLLGFEKEMLIYLGYDASKFAEGNYVDIAKEYGVDELEHEHEARLCAENGPAFFLKNFPHITSPFWNMKKNADGQTARKIDVLLSGVETIGSAERSCDPDDMRKSFYEISGGEYSKTLFDKFGRERVEEELNAFLALPFIQRSGGGIGCTRLISSMLKEGLLE